MTDFDLLSGYASSGSEDGFAALVGRYANLVYSAALRQMRNPHDAEEISQAVFMILARKAGTIGKDTVFPGWLLRTTRLVALNALRKESHRRRAESEAMSLYLPETDSAWKQIAPVLDEALVSLSDKDRDAVALRFFEQKSFKEIGSLLGTSEDNARKRVSRALDKLRALCGRRGVVVPAAAFAAAVTTNAVQAAPSYLAASAASAVTAGTAAAGSASSLAKATLAALERARLKTLGLKGMGVALVLVVALLALHFFRLKTLTPSIGGLGAANRTEAPASPPPSAARAGGSPIPAPASLGQLRLRVMDSQTEAPIRNARITSNGGFPNSLTNVAATDNLGECLISFNLNPGEYWNLLIQIIRDGYVPRFVSWAEARGDMIADIPAEYTVKLARGEVIGGVVLTKSGEPVQDVKVSLGGPDPKIVPDGPPEREGLAIEHVEVTDAQGRWLCNHAPPQLEAIDFSLSHPDYVAATFGIAKVGATTNLGRIHLLEADLRNQSAVMILKPGLVVTGVVVDRDGNPIVGAKVTRDRAWHDLSARETTEADGRFRFGNAPERDLILTVQADGFLAKDLTVHPGGKTNEVRFVLANGAVLRGQVVGESGKPIARASVTATGGDFSNGRFEWGTRTDETGKFEWRSAPPSQTLYQVSSLSYNSATNVELAPDGSEHLITIRQRAKGSRFRITGTALDAETGQPLDTLEVWVAPTIRQRGYAQRTLGPRLQTTGRDGKFSFVTRYYNLDPVESYAVEIRANGYSPATVVVPGQLTNNYQVNFKLKAARVLTGVAQMPDGQPAVGAVVLLCASDGRPAYAYMKLAGQLDMSVSLGDHVETDTTGGFVLPTTAASGTLFIAHNSGYSEMPMEHVAPSDTLKLQPWGRVAGLLKIGGQPGSNETIILDNMMHGKPPLLSLHLSTTTDAAGHFVIEGVPPGERRISHQLKVLRGRALLTQTARIQVGPGQTTQVTLGGAGRKVVGRFQGNEPSQRINWQGCTVTLTTEMPGLPVPSRDQFTSAAKYATTISEWRRRKFELEDSAAGQEALRNWREYVAVPEADGSFAINDVVSGTYELKVMSDFWGQGELRSPRRDEVILMHLLESMTRQVIVPEASASDTTPFDIGILETNSERP